MGLQVVRPTTRAEWNKALVELPAPHLLQTWEWGSFKSRHGWEPRRYLWTEPETEEPFAAASVLTRRLSPLPLAVVYVPKGPILDYRNGTLLEVVLDQLERVARRGRAACVKIDPDVRPDTSAGQAVLEVLRRRGWCRSDEEIQFRNTIFLDLTPSLDALLMGMKSKWRYNIRLAERKGVTVRRGSCEDHSLLYSIYEETASRGGFIIRPESYYRDAWGSFIEAGLAQPLIAEVEDEAIAMVIIYRFGKRAYYMYGGSRSVHRERMPNNLLQWEAIKWAKEKGCTVYDMWGAPDQLDESDPMWGVYRFKEGFGGEFVEHIGAWDYPPSGTVYWLYSVAMPRVLAVMRRLHWQRASEGS
ncbi:MAG: peptidoglycan bridge formation glycyltransferase FemA/FemB family protein [Anaerolineae bacterium]